MADWLNMIIEDRVNPETFQDYFPWAKAMIGCLHDPVYHAEGDPWVHTKMVVHELVTSPAYLALSPERQAILRLAGWMHDIGKPATTEVLWDEKEQRERIGQPGHAPLGAAMSHQALVDAGVDIQTARDVHALVFWHMRPTFMFGENNMERRAIEYSINAGGGCWNELLTLCRADNRGRISKNVQKNLDELDLLELTLKEMGENLDCNPFHEPWPFTTSEARMKYLRSGNKGSAFYMPENRHRGRMILLSGLPGGGKNTLIDRCFPEINTVSLDDIRGQMNVGWTDNQGQVVQAGFEAARVEMRQCNDFIWNATCLTRLLRQKIIGLARDYDYSIEGISFDIPFDEVKSRNRARDRSVPDDVMEKLARKREPIMSDEVHILSSINAEGHVSRIIDEPAWLEQKVTSVFKQDSRQVSEQDSRQVSEQDSRQVSEQDSRQVSEQDSRQVSEQIPQQEGP